ncbi:molybdopterin synthase catalytic subunit [Cimex lectularius]|uniref:Molybdopterin synthase catalytic subunit n=1 Tax=Cimex lectularius TaxID=79782 RepID=A0A8I6TGS6_CIMLE|nr:molybdopterin synthase catalytic subunit [Cimex lectularius]
MDSIILTEENLSIEEACQRVGDNTCGAISTFVGTTRDSFEGKRVISLVYETYKPMAVKEMEKICARMRQRWDGVRHICFRHRLGEVAIGEASVIIAVSSVHRADALAAVGYAIDELKKTVPIWKKEQYADEPAVWKENTECDWKSPS